MTQVNNFIFVNMKANLKYRLTLKEKNMYSWSTLFLFKAFDYVVTILTKSLIQVFLIFVRCVDQQYEKAPRRFKLCFCNLQSPCRKDTKSFGIKVVLQQKKTVCHGMSYSTKCIWETFFHFSAAATFKRRDFLLISSFLHLKIIRQKAL